MESQMRIDSPVAEGSSQGRRGPRLDSRKAGEVLDCTLNVNCVLFKMVSLRVK